MKKKFFAIFGLCILIFSCSDEDADIPADPAQRIYLRATVENAIRMSRAPFSLSKPNERNPLKVAVWASTTIYKFEDLDKKGTLAENGEVALHATANFTNGQEQLLNEAVYPSDGTTVYFVGLHPAVSEANTGWTTNGAGTIAEKTFNGSEDVMFAPQITGVYGQNVETWPTFKFNHLLTWLRVRLKAEDEIVSEAWGKLKSLEVKSASGNTVTVDLSKDYSQEYNPGAEENCVRFSDGNGVTLDFYETGTDKVFVTEDDPDTWYTLRYDDFEEVAYVLCAPVIASTQNLDGDRTNEYTLIVKTERRTVEVPVDLVKDETTCFEGSTMNRQFVLNLNFKMGNSILVTASVIDWNVGGISNGQLNP